jgi:hypothetical protein
MLIQISDGTLSCLPIKVFHEGKPFLLSGFSVGYNPASRHAHQVEQPDHW